MDCRPLPLRTAHFSYGPTNERKAPWRLLKSILRKFMATPILGMYSLPRTVPYGPISRPPVLDPERGMSLVFLIYRHSKRLIPGFFLRGGCMLTHPFVFFFFCFFRCLL